MLFVYDGPDLLQEPDQGTVLDLLLLPVKETSQVKYHIHFNVIYSMTRAEFNSQWAGKPHAEANRFR